MKQESMKADRNNPKHLQMSSPNTYVASASSFFIALLARLARLASARRSSRL